MERFGFFVALPRKRGQGTLTTANHPAAKHNQRGGEPVRSPSGVRTLRSSAFIAAGVWVGGRFGAATVLLWFAHQAYRSTLQARFAATAWWTSCWSGVRAVQGVGRAMPLSWLEEPFPPLKRVNRVSLPMPVAPLMAGGPC